MEEKVTWRFHILEDDSGHILQRHRSVDNLPIRLDSPLYIRTWSIFRENGLTKRIDVVRFLQANNLKLHAVDASLGDKLVDDYLANAIKVRIKRIPREEINSSLRVIESSFDEFVRSFVPMLTGDYDPISERKAVCRYLVANPKFKELAHKLLLERATDTTAGGSRPITVRAVPLRVGGDSVQPEPESTSDEQGQDKAITRSFYVLEDDSGHRLAFDLNEPGFETLRWVEYHCNVEIEMGIWRLQLRPDDDTDLKREERGCADSNGRLNTKSKLTRFLRINRLHLSHSEAALGDEVFDDYLAKKIGEYTARVPRDRLSRTIETVEGSFADYVDQFIESSEFRIRIVKELNISDSDRDTIRDYFIANPRYEELVNKNLDEQLLGSVAKRPSSEKADTIRTTVEPCAPSNSSGQISSWDRHGLLLAPNGRCPKCNYPLSTRKSGLSAGKAAAGGILAGPAGAIVGASIGKKEYYCPSCGYRR